MGSAFASKKQYEKALECFEKAIFFDPKSVGIWNSLGNIYYNKKKYLSAAECFEKAIELDPDNAIIWLNVCQDCYDKILEENPNDIDKIVHKGHLFRLRKDLHQALATYEQALQIEPNNFLARHWWAKVAKKLKKSEQNKYQKQNSINNRSD